MHVEDRDVAAVLDGGSTTPPDTRAILGYAAALTAPLPGPDRCIDLEAIRAVNRIVLAQEGDEGPGGKWREEVMNREAFDAHGQALGWVFPTLPPRLIPEKAEDLLTWLECELRGGERHPVLVVGGFMLGFLAVSPFIRGNGRTSRVLIRHLLTRAGYEHLPFASLEREFERDREAYLNALFQARTGVWSGDADLAPWLAFFLAAVDRHRDRVEAKLTTEKQALELPPLQREILDAVHEHGTVNAALLLRATGANRNTLKDNLRRLVDRGVLLRTGQKRGTRYRLAAAVDEDPAAPVKGVD